MKKLLLSILALTITQTSNAQKLYVKLNTGYNFPASFGKDLTLDGFPNIGSGLLFPEDTMRARKKGSSMAAGMHLQLSAGYQFAKKLSAEVTVDYGVSGTKYTANTEMNTLPTTITQKGSSQLIIIPSLTYSIIAKTHDRLYVKLGAVLPLSNSFVTETTTTAASNDYFYAKSKTTTGFSLGGYAGIGYNYLATERFGVFGEFTVTYLSQTVKHTVVSAAESNGVDLMNTLTQSQKEVNYISGYKDNQNQNPDAASSASSYKQPFSSVGIRVGIFYQMKKKKQEER